MNVSTYTPLALKLEAHRITRERGRYLKHEIRVSNNGVQLVAYFVPRGHPCHTEIDPPLAAIQTTTMLL